MGDDKQVTKYNVSILLESIEALKTEVLELREENETLWCYLQDEKASKASVGDKLVELMESEIQDEWLKKLKPIGEA
tara:strand:- start:1150 stop:1380 length:231 start_codon:yes stop_codon:yes gene_type:complete